MSPSLQNWYGEWFESSPEEKVLEVLVDDTQHELEMHARSPEGKSYPGLHQENCNQ